LGVKVAPRWWLLWFAAGGLCACDEAEPSGRYRLGTPAGDDGGVCGSFDLECDVREPECQQIVYEGTACVGGFSADQAPEVRTITAVDFEAELLAELQADAPDARSRRASVALQALGLLPVGQSLEESAVSVSTENVGAYYDNELERVTVIDRGGRRDPTEDLFELSHEFAHALRDLESDLGALRDRWVDSTDAFVATSALVEGEAMVISANVMLQSERRSPDAFDWAGFGEAVLDSVLASIEAAEDPFATAVQGLPYGLGASRLGPLWQGERRGATDPLYERPDVSLIAWVDPPAEVDPLECIPTGAPPGYVAENHDKLGLAAVLALDLRLTSSEVGEAFDLSHAWRDDRIVIFAPEGAPDSDDAAAAWRVRFESAQSASLVHERVECCLPSGVQSVSADRELLLFVASDPAVLEGWTTATSCGSEADLPPSEDQPMAMQAVRRPLLGYKRPMKRAVK
jgi:hypothetical protein